MAGYGRQHLRNLFDESPTPHIAHPPRTHHRDFYVATDGSYRTDGDGGLGVVIEARNGTRIARLAVPDSPPNNNVAEYRALHLGLDVLAARAPPSARVGIVVDHDDLAGDVNLATLAARDPRRRPPRPYAVPNGVRLHWRGICARLNDFTAARAASVASRENPAHPLANTPTAYRHVNNEPDRCVRPDAPSVDQIPPPSRRNRPRAGD